MTTNAYVTPSGVYLMSFNGDDDVPPPSPDAIRVHSVPYDARQIYDFASGKFGDVLPSLEEYEAAIQAHVDQTAVSRQFRDGVTLASYTASTHTQWAAEAQVFVAWRDQVWAYAYQEMARVQAGERAQPSVEEILSELPAIDWP